LEIARRVIWFEPPEKALADPVQFMAYAMTYAVHEDMRLIRQFVSDRSSLRIRSGSSAGSQIRTRCGVARAKSGSQNTDQATESKQRGSVPGTEALVARNQSVHDWACGTRGRVNDTAEK
jgi:hypothetical protein